MPTSFPPNSLSLRWLAELVRRHEERHPPLDEARAHAEARALANGDPRFIGYMTGNSMQRGFPQYVRAFNRAFLALPALPSVRLAGAASHPDVVVREIKTPKDGTWYAVVNTGMKDAENVRVKLTAPGLADFFTGRPVAAAAPLALYPGQVLVWHAAP